MAKKRYIVEFSEGIEPLIKELKSCGFDYRDILNAGVLLFSRLNGDEQKNAIKEAMGSIIPLEKKTLSIREVLKKYVEQTKKSQDKSIEIQPSERIIIQPSDQKLWNELNRILEENKESKKQKSG